MAFRDVPAPTGRGLRRAAVAALTAGGLLLVGPLSGASAAPTPTPTPPSAADVSQAQQAVQSASNDVAAMEVRLAQLSAAADDAQIAVEKAGEAYTQALSDAQGAQQVADDTAARSAQADSDAETARQNLMAYAREMARSGGSADVLEAVLSANGFQDVAQRTADLSMLTGKADQTVQSYRAAQLVADTLRQRATDAARVAAGKQADAQAALAAAQRAQDDATKQVQDAQVQRDDLIAQLAAAQQTSVAVERARQDAIDQARVQRQEDAAKAQRLAPPTTTTTSPAGPTAPATTPATTAPTTPATTAPTTPATTAPTESASTHPTAPPTTPAPVTTTPPSSGGTGGAYGLGTGRSRGTAAQGAAALAFAMAQIGKPYVWGGAGPNAYDCSGLTSTSWLNAGVAINRTAADQYKQVLKIAYDQLRPGDLVFWTDSTSDPNQVYHVAMWAGNGQIVEAARPGVPLRLTTMRWSGTMPYAGRP